jgi:hypothetical protein
LVSPLRGIASLVTRIARWIVPYAVWVRFRGPPKNAPAAILTPGELAERERIAAAEALASPNAAVAGRHPGERCFILCNGPSVNRQDLSALTGETVISVTNAYHHAEFNRIRPRYHCVPQISYVKLTEGDVVAWFREMDSCLGDAELFLSSTEEPLVRRHALFLQRTVRYVFFMGGFESLGARIPDIAGRIPGVQSVPIMGLSIAMYMGFRQIYLLGTDHDSFITGEYKYFYEPTVLRGKDLSVDMDGRVLTNRHDDFQGLATLWRQYRALRQIAEANNIEIFNATAGGALDEFPRISLDSIVPR